jgi:dCMP deaminase
MAKHVAQWSKDPSTKTGAVLTTPDRLVLSVGYNGFPAGIADDARLEDREEKYAIIVHCERNAVLHSMGPVKGSTLYTWPFGSCTVCASLMITAGVARVVFPECPPDKLERWGADLMRAERLYREAGVLVEAYPTSYGQ